MVEENLKQIDIRAHNREFGTAYGTALDRKNTDLSKVVYDLRQDLDIHCLLCANWSKIYEGRRATQFFVQVRRRALDSIVLGICKIYEDQKTRHELNSVDGIIRQLQQINPTPLYPPEIEEFLRYYCEDPVVTTSVEAIDALTAKFRAKHQDHLRQFKNARDKVIAHSEYDVVLRTVPSYDIMEQLFLFAARFYAMITSAFVGGSPDDLTRNRRVKTSLRSLLQQLGLEDVKEDLE
jgi:hypothetical protein